MSPRDSADTLAASRALRDNRRLDLRWPVTPLTFAREYLETLRARAHRIITRDYHRSNALSPNQAAQTPRWASPTQGGGRTALTRLAAPGRESWSERLKAALAITRPEQIDDDLLALVRQAWERS